MRTRKTAGATESTNGVAHDGWRRLYDLAARVRALEPWLWMEEMDIFGVADSAEEDPVFVSVMGSQGEYLSIAAYPGRRALTDFLETQRVGDQDLATDILCGLHHAQAAFGSKGELLPEEKRLLAALQLKFTGKFAWPQFRSFRPGWMPALADPLEVRWLVPALEQLLEVAHRFRQDPRLFGTEPDRYLVRIPSEDGEGWQDIYRTFPPLGTFEMRILVPDALMEALAEVEQCRLTVQVDIIPSFIAVGKPGERGQSPFLMLAVDAESGAVLGFELLPVEQGIDDMRSEAPVKLFELFRDLQIRPARITVRKVWLHSVLEDYCRELDIRIEPDLPMPALMEARQAFYKQFRRP